MKDFTMRTSLIVGDEGIDKLEKSNVIVFGVGGVGSFATEALVRAGVGNITIVDFDNIDVTNINRQIPALHSTVGKLKVDVMKERLLDINPDLNIRTVAKKYNKETTDEILVENYDYVIDAIDMVTSKILLVEECNKKGLKLISSMGMGNKLDPTKIVVTDIHKTHTCPLAKVMRKELKDRRIKNLKVVYSQEQPQVLKKKIMNGRKVTPGSTSFVPSVGGLIIASVVVNDLINS
ncbi:tRNA threonylcarbamoyladenosine dehydratase [Terrisporobacter vanillatitrophus]|uniref:tRNA threonylcarbamoyladenosine dehydratase n=1 Tax=Terrisporobacter vanillatitrophus TaxID=3058402 RepID=UPI00336762AC